MKYQWLGFLVPDVIKTFPVLFFSYFLKPQRLKYHLVAFLEHDVIKHFLVLFQITTHEILVTCFSSTWHSKTFHVLFFSYFFKPQRLKYQLLAFLVHDVIKHFPVLFQMTTYEIPVTCCDSTWCYKNIFLYFFKPQPFEISVTCFSSTWRNKNIFPYSFPVLFQTTTFEISVTCFSSWWHYQTFSRTFFKSQRMKY